MENNPTNISQTPQQPNPTQPVINPVTNVAQASGGSKKVLWIILVIVILILVIGGLYWFRTQQSANSTTQNVPAASSAASSQNVDSLATDLNANSLNDIDKDFSSVDTDLGSL